MKLWLIWRATVRVSTSEAADSGAMRSSHPGTVKLPFDDLAKQVIKTVPVSDLQRTLREKEFTLDMCTATRPHCGKENLFPGFSEMLAFTCRRCGQPVDLSDQ